MNHVTKWRRTWGRLAARRWGHAGPVNVTGPMGLLANVHGSGGGMQTFVTMREEPENVPDSASNVSESVGGPANVRGTVGMTYKRS